MYMYLCYLESEEQRGAPGVGWSGGSDVYKGKFERAALGLRLQSAGTGLPDQPAHHGIGFGQASQGFRGHGFNGIKGGSGVPVQSPDLVGDRGHLPRIQQFAVYPSLSSMQLPHIDTRGVTDKYLFECSGTLGVWWGGLGCVPGVPGAHYDDVGDI